MTKIIECEGSLQLSFSNLWQLFQVDIPLVIHDIQMDMNQVVISLITLYVCSAPYNQSSISTIQKTFENLENGKYKDCKNSTIIHSNYTPFLARHLKMCVGGAGGWNV